MIALNTPDDVRVDLGADECRFSAIERTRNGNDGATRRCDRELA